MSSKKYHRDPRYHKLRNISRQSTSTKSSVRKHFRERKAYDHRSIRKLVQMKLREASKNYRASDSIYDDCESDLTPNFIDLKRCRYPYSDLKTDRWQFDALNPCLRWANSIIADSGELKLRQFFGIIDNVSISHLKFHVFFVINQDRQTWPSRTRQSLEREFSSRGLRPTSNPRKQLIEIAQQASVNQREALLNAWTKELAKNVYYKDERIWLWSDQQNFWRTRAKSVQNETYCRGTNKGLAISNSWWIDLEQCSVITVKHQKADVVDLFYQNLPSCHAWEWYCYAQGTRFTVTESAMAVKQLGRAINKYKWHITDRLTKRIFEIDLTKNIEKDSPFLWFEKDSPFLWATSGTKGLTFDQSIYTLGKIWRPLNGFEDSEAWATDIHQFLQFSCDRQLFESAYWRWIVCELLTAVMPN